MASAADDISQLYAIHIRLDPSYAALSDWKGPEPGRTRIYATWDSEGGIEEAADPNYTQSEVYGRSEPYQSFANTGARTVSFAIKLQCADGNPKKEVVDEARFLESLKYPLYNQSRKMSFAPPPVLVRVGELLNIRAVVTACSIKWNGPFEPVSLLPHGADISLTLTVVRRSDAAYAFDGVWQ